MAREEDEGMETNPHDLEILEGVQKAIASEMQGLLDALDLFVENKRVHGRLVDKINEAQENLNRRVSEVIEGTDDDAEVVDERLPVHVATTLEYNGTGDLPSRLQGSGAISEYINGHPELRVPSDSDTDDDDFIPGGDSDSEDSGNDSDDSVTDVCSAEF